MDLSERRFQPLQVDVQKSRELTIRWADGHTSAIPLAKLRIACPCATCRAWREERQKNPLAILQNPGADAEKVIVDSAELVGNYALRVRWKDGHDTGLYDFVLLRGLAPARDEAKQ